jgi:myb proto-oncogene protein
VCRAVSRHGEKNWSTVARTFNQLMGRPPLLGRAPKQCRSRYLQQLVPGIKTGEWSVEEEEILVEGHKQFGNQWTLIASMLPGRTETSVKNHYNCTARRWVPRLKPPVAE